MASPKVYALLVAATLLVPAMLATTPAQAQSRNFACDNRQGMVKLTVIGAHSITAGPIQANTITLKQSDESPLYYINGDYGVRVSQSQTEIDVEIPDYGTVHCRYAPDGSALARQAMAENPCGPAGKQVPETDRCVDINASAAEAQLPMWGASLGGIVRAGPGMNTAKVASLREGDRVQIMHDTEQVMNGYNWFQIKFRGRSGYQWGGIMCSEDPLPGIYARCKR